MVKTTVSFCSISTVTLLLLLNSYIKFGFSRLRWRSCCFSVWSTCRKLAQRVKGQQFQAVNVSYCAWQWKDV